MAGETRQVGPSLDPGAGREAKWRDLGFWLITLAWGTGAFIYGWLLVGGFEKREYWNRDYWNQIYEAWSIVNFWIPLICGIVVAALFSFFGTLAKKPAEGEGRQLFRIVVAVLPALFLVSALAVLTLTLATYNADWKEARQGIATAFAALIAAVGVVVSVAVSYRTGEENRKAQKEIEYEKGEREERKQDAELIKNLNDRLHEIIPRRYGDKPKEVSASYFQLAALYKDWETLAATSPLIASQQDSQQRNILKILFGVHEEENERKSSVIGVEIIQASAENNQQKDFDRRQRNQADIRTLNSVIQDIFPSVEDKDPESNENNKIPQGDAKVKVFDLSYLDLRALDFTNRNLAGAILQGAHLEGSKLVNVDLRNAYLNGAYLTNDVYFIGTLLQGAHLEGAHLQEAYLDGAHLEGAHLNNAKLKRAHLSVAHLQGAHFRGADLSDAWLYDAKLEGAELEGAYFQKPANFFAEFHNVLRSQDRQEVVNQLKVAKSLHKNIKAMVNCESNDNFVQELKDAHQKYWEEKEKV